MAIFSGPLVATDPDDAVLGGGQRKGDQGIQLVTVLRAGIGDLRAMGRWAAADRFAAELSAASTSSPTALVTRAVLP